MHRFTGGLIVLMLALVPQQARALVVYAPWVYTIASADMIVAGTVVEADVIQGGPRGDWDQEKKREPTLQLLVDEVIVGDCEFGRKVEVMQRRYDACVPFLTGFAIGQRVLLILDRGETAKSPATLRGDYHIVVADDQEFVVDVDERGEPAWREAWLYQPYRTAVADFRASFRFVSMSRPMHTREQHGSSLLPCSRIDYFASAQASTGFRKRYPPGMAPPVVPFKDRSPMHAMIYEKVQTEQRRIEHYKEEIARHLIATALPL